MHRTLRPFELLEPSSLTEATGLLGRCRDQARVLAGGIDLVAKMRRWESAPKCVVSLRRIPGLDRMTVNQDGGLEIGPLVSLRALERFAPVREAWPVLHESVRQIASVQVKTMGTVIGNLCVGTPASDVAVALYVLGARLNLLGPDGERELPIEEFFVPVASTTCAAVEIVTRLTVPPSRPGTGTAFRKLAHTKACIAKVNAAALVTLDQGICSTVRVALGAVGPTIIRARRAEAVLKGQVPTPELIATAADLAASEARPQDDLRASAAYRLRMARVLAARALTEAVDVAAGGR